LAQKISDFKMQAYEMRDLWDILPAYGGMNDSYISVNRFWGTRAVARLACLSSLYSDLDYYQVPELADMHPQGITWLAFEELERARIPRPSLAVATGRGLALIWRHDPVPRAALSRWKLCQDHIFRALKCLGADPAARDAARVLRLVGTRNSKSGTIVEAVWEDDAEGIWTFDELANEILPLTREQLEELRAKRRESRESRERPLTKGRKRAPKSRDDVEKRFTATDLALSRMSDLQLLLKLRGQDMLPPGQRDAWMFVAGASMAHLVEPQFLERELITLGEDHAGWSEAETRSRMNSVVSRAEDAGADKKIEWNGQRLDPRYRLKNQTIIEMLGITPTGEKKMKTIISKDTKRQRKTERQRQKRRAEGVKPRDEYLDEAEKRKSRVQELHQQGLSYRKIGEKVGLSHTQVRRIISSHSDR
jgi:hypothetical protein